MPVLRGVDDFGALWERRTVVASGGIEIDLMAIEDLVLAKKTQHDKDWPMIRRLVERYYFTHEGDPTPARVAFWLGELRSPELLIEVVQQHPAAAVDAAAVRPAVAAAIAGDVSALERRLAHEEEQERRLDREYWAPLRLELERFRRDRR